MAIQNLEKLVDEKFKGQKRKNNANANLHSFEVKNLLFEAGCSQDIVDAGLCHDLIEDTNTTWKELSEHISEESLRLVKLCTQEKGQSMEDFVNQWKNDEAANMIKGADRLSNTISSLEYFNGPKDKGEFTKHQIKFLKKSVKYYLPAFFETNNIFAQRILSKTLELFNIVRCLPKSLVDSVYPEVEYSEIEKELFKLRNFSTYSEYKRVDLNYNRTEEKMMAFVIFYSKDNQPWLNYDVPGFSEEKKKTIVPTVLVLFRGDNKFGFPGGMVEANETPKEAAVREVSEEINFLIQKDDIELYTIYKKDNRLIYGYICELKHEQLKLVADAATTAEHYGSEIAGINLIQIYPDIEKYSSALSKQFFSGSGQDELNNLILTKMR